MVGWELFVREQVGMVIKVAPVQNTAMKSIEKGRKQ
jgi:hypothetical protein